MKDIQSIYFVAGGVLLPQVYFAAIRLLEERGLTVSDRDRIEIRRLENSLLTNPASEEAFFASLACMSSIPRPLTRKDFLENSCMDPDLPALLRELSLSKDMVLFSDYPKSWLSEFDRDGTIASLFNRVVYLEEMGCSNIHAAILDRLVLDNQLSAAKSLWVDGDPLRTSMSLRRGIDAIIYVGERLLRRELQLRSIL